MYGRNPCIAALTFDVWSQSVMIQFNGNGSNDGLVHIVLKFQWSEARSTALFPCPGL